MGKATVWSNSDGLAVGFGTRSVTTSGAFGISDNGSTQKLHCEFDWSDLDTSLSTTSDFIVYGPVIPNGAVILKSTLKVTEAFTSGTDIDIGLYDKDGAAVDAAGLDAAVITANLTLGAEIDGDGSDVNTVVATTGGVKVGVIRTGVFDAGQAVLEVEFKTPQS